MDTVSIASDAQKKKKARTKKDPFSQAMMMGDGLSEGLSLADVERDATQLHQWLEKTDSPLREFIAACSDGGAFFVANVHVKTARGFLRFHKLSDEEGATAGVGVNDFVLAAQGRLCD